MVILVWISHVLLIFLIAFGIWKREKFSRVLFWPCLLIKLMAGIASGLLYTYYFPVADTLSYFRDASRLAALAGDDFSSYIDVLFFNADVTYLNLIFAEPRALFLTKITSILNLVTFNNYWLISLYFSLISFLASWYLVKTISAKMSFLTVPSVVALLCMPSVVFWSSGLMKESLAVAALFVVTAVFIKIYFQEKPTIPVILLVVLSFWTIWNLKYYYLAVFIPVVFTALVHKYVNQKRFVKSGLLETVLWLALFLLPQLLVSFLHPNFNPDRLLDVIVNNNEAYNSLSAPGDFIQFPGLQPSVVSVLEHAPWALFSGLFRPFVWEAGTTLQFVAGMENTLLLLFFLGALFRTKRFVSSPHRMLLLATIVYVCLLCIMITLSAPNFGTLSRYRTGYLPFFVLLILYDNPLLIYLQRSFRRLVSQ